MIIKYTVKYTRDCVTSIVLTISAKIKICQMLSCIKKERKSCVFSFAFFAFLYVNLGDDCDNGLNAIECIYLLSW